MTVTDDHVVNIYLTRAELAARLRLGENALAHWPSRNYGPKPYKFGGKIRYKLAEVEQWEDDQAAGGAA